MKTGSRILYIIGAILAVIAILVGAIIIGVGNFTIQNAQEIMEQTNAQSQDVHVTIEDVRMLGQGMIIAGIVVAVLGAIDLVVAIIATLAFKKGRIQNAPHIIMVVIGVLSANIFFLIGGILGLLAQKEEA